MTQDTDTNEYDWLTRILAEELDEDPAEIERGADEFEMVPPWECDWVVVEDD